MVSAGEDSGSNAEAIMTVIAERPLVVMWSVKGAAVRDDGSASG
jgi:hypothetical protein